MYGINFLFYLKCPRNYVGKSAMFCHSSTVAFYLDTKRKRIVARNFWLVSRNCLENGNIFYLIFIIGMGELGGIWKNKQMDLLDKHLKLLKDYSQAKQNLHQFSK
jgi:hypothetical protein